jgi:hypothetical protein
MSMGFWFRREHLGVAILEYWSTGTMGYEFGRHQFRLTSIHNEKVNSLTANCSCPTFQHSIIPSFQLYPIRVFYV